MKLRADMRAVDDVGKKSTKHLKLDKKQTGLLDDEAGGVAPKAYNVILQLADASTSAPSAELNPNDVPSWRTKMCQNRITILQAEKRKLEGKSQMVQEEIRKKTLLKNRTAADLSWKKKEISFVGDTITDFRKGLHQREVDAAQTARRGRTAILTETRGIGEEMRAQQTFREKDMFAMSEFDLAERTRRNQEGAKQQTLTLSALFASMEREKRADGEERRTQRLKNTQTCAHVAQAELRRLQELNDAVNKEQQLSATRLREKREEVQARRSALYVADRTAQFNAFKTAAAAASHMQGEAAGIVEEVRRDRKSVV